MAERIEKAGAPADPESPVPIEQVLWDELRHLERHDGSRPAPPLDEVYRSIGALPEKQALSALCFSGGGIRSATFNLGVVQALARLEVLGRFDYFSSVSGGGYIAGWLKAWMHRVPMEDVTRALATPARAPGSRPLAPEPEPIHHLRDYSNYLTPRVGLLSADTWAAAALYVRNLILNWLVLVPVLTAAVAIPQIALIVASTSRIKPFWGRVALVLAIAAAVWSSAAIHRFRRRRVAPASEKRILLLGIAPLWLASLLLCTAALWLPGDLDPLRLAVFCGLWCVAIPLLGWIVALATAPGQEIAPPWSSDVAGLILSGLVTALVMFASALPLLPALKSMPPVFVVLALPALMGLYLLARALFVAFASLGAGAPRAAAASSWTREHAHADHEWWARLSGWVLILTVAWIGASALVVLGGYFVRKLFSGAVAAAGGVSGLITALLGSSAGTSRDGDARPKGTPALKELALRLLAPLTIACIVLLLAKLSAWTGGLLTGIHNLFEIPSLRYHLELPGAHTLRDVLPSFLLVPLGFFLVSWLLGWVVNVNRFSAHGLYRNRLVRAYLGASRDQRERDPFTGFDPGDNLPLHALAGGRSPRPLPVINAALNLVSGDEHAAWQQRKAQSFSMTPLYCGSFHGGYRRSREYGGSKGISLGTAVTISGAAANPNAGYHSSPLVGFLMTLFNVRLGAWLGNPNEHGRRVFRLAGPRHAWKPLFGDLFGMTDARHPYVSLSDGGHFENLGVYEMVLRRCRLVVVSDAGQDESHDFEDLANLVRKVRIDFGVEIEFERPIRILARSEDGRHGMMCAQARIRYDLVDQGTPPGRLLYLKPTLLAERATIPYDVIGYARTSKKFPHEPTVDQWFSEAQFESYRALGRHLAGQLGGGKERPDLPALFEAVKEQLEAAESAPPPATQEAAARITG